MITRRETTKLRIAQVGDVDAVASIYLGARRRYVGFARLAHSDAEIRVWLCDQLIPAGLTWVLDDNGSVVAFMALEKRGKGGWIDQLYVHPDLTGRGHGTRLLALAKLELSAPIRLYTFQENTRARRFYERAGFIIEKLSDGQDNEERCPDVLYRWPA